MGLRKTPAALAALGAAAALAIAGCSSGGSSTTGATSSSSAPAQLTVWRMGASVPSEVTWMNGVSRSTDYLAYADSVKSGPWTWCSGMLANDTQNGSVYGVPWFGGVRGIWYRTDEFKAAGITSPPATWAQLVTDAQKLMAKNPGTYGIGAPSIPVMVFFLIVQRRMVNGLVAGAVKG